MLEAIQLTKTFKNTQAVKGVNLYLEKGETVGLLGPNGAGKSTTISMLSSLVHPTSGDVLLKGESVKNQPKHLREILGVVPQEIAVFPDLTALENMSFFGQIYKLPKQGLKQRIEEMLTLVGLEKRQKEIVKTFSGGMKRRLNIAVALLHTPQILIMDEPTVGIDPQSRNYILETVKKLNEEKGMTVLYTSHYMEEVEFLCKRIYIMDRGEVIASGTKDEVKNILSSEHTIEVEVEKIMPDFMAKLDAIPAISSVTTTEEKIVLLAPKNINLLEDVFSAAKETACTLKGIQIKAPTLEDVFLHLTGRTLRD
ncbi:ABC transporter ATP-binding protein [Sutcliffiella rhizosphaerae]|uniref:Linearmycin resistance ATP-binding protein LnrL n=1 Tax=Sutcliffiella rhizosphaerae TaxID=2880967 RepID=A0ABM8YQ31_9BACI|nr:ABC transporter ATP-binding protein [Sutcliffiella rhizosphaerae]CAG9622083.1 Linearmycin resistance ATP-binding protein LnrL [Sutcliffiella rhizosphaerae]